MLTASSKGTCVDDEALAYSTRVQAAAAALGFDWPDAFGVVDKLVEETGEIREALEAGDIDHGRKELGDLLLAAVNLARFLDADPAAELVAATRRFENRFALLRARCEERGVDMKSCSLESLDHLWEEVKTVAAQRPEKGG